MKEITENSKRIKLKEQLAARIVNGEFKFGEQFPILNQICTKYNVSYVTANKAMKILVKEGYLQVKNGVGYFVCYVHPNIIPPRKVINFITGLEQNSSNWSIIYQGKELFEKANWHVNLLKIPQGDLSSCVAEINSPDAYSILFFTKLNWEHFTATYNHITQRVIVLGHLSGNENITSIISDEYETIHKCMEYFHSKNRKKTALISTSCKKELEMLRIGAWRSFMLKNGSTLTELGKLFLNEEDIFNKNSSEIKKIYKDFLEKNYGNIDSVIDSFAPGLLAEVCEEIGLKVAKDIDIICIARSEKFLSKYPILTLDNNLYKHFQFAFEILEERFKTGRKIPGAWIFCPPGKLYN